MGSSVRLINVLDESTALKSAEAAGWNTAPSEKDAYRLTPMPAVVLADAWNGPASEDELRLVQRLFFLPATQLPRVVVFAGIEAGDRAEMVCMRAAETLASQTRDKVCVIDASFSSSISQLRYALKDSPALNQPWPKKEAGDAQGVLLPNLWALSLDGLEDSGLSPDSIRDHLSELREAFGFLLICAPPLSSGLEGYMFGRTADGVVLTILANSTNRAAAVKVRTTLDEYGIRLLGVVMNRQPCSPG
jgi:hypothetical protein